MSYSTAMLKSGEALEHSDCPLCFSPAKKVLYHLQDPFRVVTCQACKFHYLNPRLEEDQIKAYYRDDGYFSNDTVGYSDYTFQEISLRLTFRRFLENLNKRGLTGGALLEVGTGYGFFLDEAGGYFDYRAGTEFSYAGAQHAARFADVIVHGGLDELQADARFDCVVLSQVIEHVYKPRKIIESIKPYLKPDGKLIMVTPDMGSFWRRIMGAGWPSFKVPEHVLFFDSKSLIRLTESCGFRQIRKIPYPHAFPLKLVAAKLNMVLPSSLASLNVWLPSTCVAICASGHE